MIFASYGNKLNPIKEILVFCSLSVLVYSKKILNSNEPSLSLTIFRLLLAEDYDGFVVVHTSHERLNVVSEIMCRDISFREKSLPLREKLLVKGGTDREKRSYKYIMFFTYKLYLLQFTSL